MKKMLVLALVLAVAGLANAGLDLVDGKAVYSVAEPLIGGINVYVGASEGPAALGAYVFRTIGAPTAAPAFTAYTGEEAATNGLPWTKGFVNLVWGDPVTTPNPAGVWFSVEALGGPFVVGDAQNFDLQIDVMDANTGAIDSLFLVVPEPMTMVLLGLGGLFLRKKK